MPERCTDVTCLEHWPPPDRVAGRDRLRQEFGDPITVWGKTGSDAWDTVIGMFAHTGWTPPHE